MPTATRWSHRVIASAVLVLLLAPAPAHAQRDQFLAAVIRLYQTLPGVFGDEGPQLTAHVEAMAAAVARWEDTIRENERQLRPQTQDANPQTALQAHTVLASLYLERNRFDAALREFDADITIDPGRAAFHRLRGLVLQAMNRHDEAAGAFRAAWLREPDDLQNAYRVVVYRSAETTAADVARALGTLAGLERALTRRERTGFDAPFMNVRAIDDDAAGAMGFVPAAYAPAFTLLLNGDYAGAVVALRSAVAADPLNTDPAMRSDRTAQGIAALKQGLVDSAIAHFEAALGAGESSQAHRLLGTAYWVSGDLGKSVLHLRAAVRLAPADERSWLALARALEGSGKLAEAVDALRTAVGELPEAGALRWQLSVTAGRRQRTEEADQLVAIAERLTLLAGKGELYDRAGRLAHGHLDYERALTLFEGRVVLTPNNATAHKTLGRAYIEAGREDSGYAELVIALLLDPFDTETLTTLGQLHLMAERPAQAVEALERAVALQPDRGDALHALSDALLKTGKTSEGQKRREESEQLRTKDVDDQRRRRNAAMLFGQADLEMAEKDYGEAIDLWQQVIALEGRDRASHLRLAEAYAAAGRLEEAAKELETAISLKAGPEAHRRLAEVYAALGRSTESARERQTYTEKRLEELRAGG